ncbi:hypothetical protein [Qipengyuania sp.]|uniref:hypothetical protein n=1 Tax=Qipengyuania sp. TaxID=2004515 RepID=UPI0035C8662B
MGAIFGIVALAPLMMGIVAMPSGEPGAIVAGMCNGGSIVIPLRDGEKRPHPPCGAKACHAGCNRKRGLI